MSKGEKFKAELTGIVNKVLDKLADKISVKYQPDKSRVESYIKNLNVTVNVNVEMTRDDKEEIAGVVATQIKEWYETPSLSIFGRGEAPKEPLSSDEKIRERILENIVQESSSTALEFIQAKTSDGIRLREHVEVRISEPDYDSSVNGEGDTMTTVSRSDSPPKKPGEPDEGANV